MAKQVINIGTNPNDGTGDTIRDGGVKINDNFTELYDFKSESIIRVKQASDLNNIDSSKIYVIDGVINMGTTEVEVRSGGLNIIGYTFEVSKFGWSGGGVSLFGFF